MTTYPSPILSVYMTFRLNFPRWAFAAPHPLCNKVDSEEGLGSIQISTIVILPNTVLNLK